MHWHAARITCLMALAPVGSVCAGQDRPSLELFGYGKALTIRVSSPRTGQAYLLSVSRLRSQVLLTIGQRLQFEVWLDTELLAGSYLQSDDYVLAQMVDSQRPWGLDWTLAEGPAYEARQRLFRASWQLHAKGVTVTAGRQRIAWGSGFAWNPTDVLNPFNPGAIELSERAGVDAAHFSIPQGALSRLELVVAQPAVGERLSVAARAGTNYRSYDVRLMAAHHRRGWVMGGDFAGYLKSAGLRGEAAYTTGGAQGSYLRAVLNADYTLEKGVYALAELYYNGRGATQEDRYNFEDLLAGDTYNLAQWYVAVSLGASLTPLVSAGLYQLANLNDGSLLIGPSATVSVLENLEAAAAAYFFAGPSDSEYGAQRHTYFATLQWYF